MRLRLGAELRSSPVYCSKDSIVYPTTLSLLQLSVRGSLGKRSGHMAVGVLSTIFAWAIIAVTKYLKRKGKLTFIFLVYEMKHFAY